MSIFLAVIILIICLVTLLFAGDKFVDAAVSLAKRMKIPEAVIGATLVSLGTTLPEILVTIFSIQQNVGGLAVGNAVGSIIFNAALIGGVLLVFGTISAKRQKGISPLILIFAILLLGVMSINGILGTAESIILLAIFAIFLIVNYFDIKKSNKEEIEDNKEINLKKTIIIFILSVIAIGVSAYFMVEEAKFLASAMKISDTFVGLVIVAIGTSLPELITTITSIRKKQSGLGIGNIIGSNIINCTLLVGLTGTFIKGGLEISKQTLFISIPVALLSSLLFLLAYYTKGKKKIYGIFLLSIYLIYYIYLILSALNVLNF